MDEGERFLSALLQSSRLEITTSINKEFGQNLQDVVQNLDPYFAQSPPFIFLKYFKSLDVDLRFASTQDLPEQIRN